MTLPLLPEHLLHIDRDDFVGRVYSEEQMLAYRAAVIEMCAANLLEAGFRSTGIPAYEALAERLRGLI